MSEKPLSLEDWIVAIRPELERQVDEWIVSAPDWDMRMAMLKRRKWLVDKLADITLIANLKRRNAELEERLRPKLVESEP
jgi:hypothetical protein